MGKIARQGSFNLRSNFRRHRRGNRHRRQHAGSKGKRQPVQHRFRRRPVQPQQHIGRNRRTFARQVGRQRFGIGIFKRFPDSVFSAVFLPAPAAAEKVQPPHRQPGGSGGQQQRNNLSLACKRNVFDLQNVAPPRFKTDNRRYHRRQPHGFAVPADAVGTKAVNQHQRGQTFDAPAAFYHAAAVSADLIFGFAGEIGRRRISAQHLSVGIKNFFAGTDGVIIDFKPHFRPHFSFADKRFQHADDAAGKISFFGAADGFAAVFRGCCRHLRPAERQQHRHHRQPGGKTDGCRQQPLPERAVCFRTLQFFHLIFQFSSLFKQNSLFRPIVKSKFFRYSQT